MEFNEVVAKRRSIRKYDESKKVTEDQLRAIIQAGIDAPTWKNSQTSRHYAAMSDEMIEKLKACLPQFNVNSIEGASAIVVSTVVANRSGYERTGEPTTEFCHNEWGIYDLGLVNENMVLKAADMGIGSLIMGIRDGAALKELFSIGDDEIVVAVIAFGYAAVEPQKPKRKAVDDVLNIY